MVQTQPCCVRPLRFICSLLSEDWAEVWLRSVLSVRQAVLCVRMSEGKWLLTSVYITCT